MNINLTVKAEECPYWNYDTHTCSHTCGSCTCMTEGNNMKNIRDSGVKIGKDRYCLIGCNVDAELLKRINAPEIPKLHLKYPKEHKPLAHDIEVEFSDIENTIQKLIQQFSVEIVEKQDEMLMQAIQTIGGERYKTVTVDKNKVLDMLSTYASIKRVISLPCEIGDRAYYILNGSIQTGVVKGISVLDNDRMRIHVDIPDSFNLAILANEVGKTLFFDEIKAIKALGDLLWEENKNMSQISTT
mgnify:CR=1 FL=1